jgi:hypothetical protein
MGYMTELYEEESLLQILVLSYLVQSRKSIVDRIEFYLTGAAVHWPFQELDSLVMIQGVNEEA